jgi:hypothetical protein
VTITGETDVFKKTDVFKNRGDKNRRDRCLQE